MRSFLHGYRVLLPGVCLAGVSVALAAQQPSPPQFRTGVDLTRLEITVLHKDTRKPSVHATVIIPDFERDALSLSGVAIGRAAGTPVGGREALADVLPFAPIVVRAFSQGDRIGALLRVHQSSRRPAQPILMETEVIDAAGAVVHSASRTVAADAFAESVGVEHRFELPLRTLTAGDYLLRFVVAAAGDARAQRDVRFSVK